MARKRKPLRASMKIITITGPSGSGKTVIAGELLKRVSNLRLVVSNTTRKPRDSDLAGEYRHNVDPKEFERKQDFIWIVSAHGNTYGTRFDSLNEALRAEHISLMIIVPESVQALLDYAPGRILPFYILPPKEQALRERLKLRGDDEKTIERRVGDCKKWNEEAKTSGIPYIFIRNDAALEKAVAQFLAHIA